MEMLLNVDRFLDASGENVHLDSSDSNSQQKSRRGRTPKASFHVGLLANEPLGKAELLFI